MKTLKILLTLVLIVIIYVNSKCQTQIRYYYDDAGNRIERVIYLPPLRPVPNIEGNRQNKGVEFDTKIIEEKIGDVDVQIYPNPTQSQISVSFLNLTPEIPLSLDMFSIEGKHISNSNIENSNSIIDLSLQPSGIYFLKIKIGNKTLEWKVIKQ